MTSFVLTKISRAGEELQQTLAIVKILQLGYQNNFEPGHKVTTDSVVHLLNNMIVDLEQVIQILDEEGE